MDALQHDIDSDMARRFLDLLDPDHHTFLFAAGDDNKERAKAAVKAGKPPWADHRHGSIDAQCVWRCFAPIALQLAMAFFRVRHSARAYFVTKPPNSDDRN